ncbi:pyruvate, phosphate dikinase, partial [Mycobacterium montefiorense]
LSASPLIVMLAALRLTTQTTP